jgi:hypothetical protein
MDRAFNNIINLLQSTNFSFSDRNFEALKETILQLKKIDFENVKKNLPNTRKATSSTATKNLKIAHESGNLNLVIGAGISKPYGIPTWDFLLQKLLLKTIEETPEKAKVLSAVFSKVFNPTPLIAGRYLQDALFDPKEKNRFETEVRETLYESYDKDANSLIMDEIVKLCAAPGNSPNLDSIISYNYDDIIEEKILEKNMDIPFQSVYGQAVDPDNRALSIYHVHGFLPQNESISEQNIITLGENVYHEQYSNIYSWNNIVQINKFRDKTCLFIGTSLSDPNIRRLLDIAKSQRKGRKFHYIIKKKTSKDWVSVRLKQILDENPQIFNDKIIANLDFEDAVGSLLEIQNRFEEKDSESLGVKTVWVRDYDTDIAEILRNIRE